MASATRETRIVAAVACPRCQAWVGSACFIKGVPGRNGQGGPAVHPERKQAWIEWKQKQGLNHEPTPIPTPCPVCQTPCSSRTQAAKHCGGAL